MRILLVEFLTTDRLRQHGSEMFPFLQGYAKAHSFPLRWLCYGVPASLPSRFQIGLSPQDSRHLCDAVRDFRADLAIFNQPLDEALHQRVASAAPTTKIEVHNPPKIETHASVSDFEDALGLSTRTGGPAVLDAVEPDYGCELANPLASQIRPMVQILCGPVCLYRRSFSRNPAFRGLDMTEALHGGGCSFCDVDDREPYRFSSHPEDLVARQVSAARRTCPPVRSYGDFLINGAAPFFRLRLVFEKLLAEDLPPSNFYFYCRIDEVRRKADEIEALLPRLARVGHSLNLFAMGVENFSKQENQRFNKGIDPSDIETTFAYLKRWERDFPNTLCFTQHGGFSFILFTPWSTLDDLRINRDEAERFRFEEKPFFFTSRLQIFARRAVALLARHDGLLVEDFEDPAFRAYDSGCVVEMGQAELPWRFQQPEVAAIYGVCCRMWPSAALPPSDALFEQVQGLMAKLPPERGAKFRWLGELIRLAEGPPKVKSTQELLVRCDAELPRPTGSSGRDWGRSNGGLDDLRSRVLSVVRALQRHPKKPLRGFRLGTVTSCRRANNETAISVVLRRGDDAVHMLLRPRGARASVLVHGGFAIDTPDGAPHETAEKRRVAQVVLHAVDRVCSR